MTDEIRKEIPPYEQCKPCPRCKEPATDGYGMAGGGIGLYNYCENCGIIVSKSADPEMS